MCAAWAAGQFAYMAAVRLLAPTRSPVPLLCDMAAQDARLIGITPAMKEGSDLVAFAALLEELRRDGVETLRHGLATDPGAFVENPEVLDRITREGNQCLPLVYVGDRLLASGKYPSRESLRAALEEPR